jgi:hypothetical protein
MRGVFQENNMDLSAMSRILIRTIIHMFTSLIKMFIQKYIQIFLKVQIVY